MPTLLAIETSQFNYSIAVGTEHSVLAEVRKNQGTAVEHLLPLLRQALQSAYLTTKQLDAVAVSSGPGSFSSLRAGLAFAKALCFSLNKPLLMVPTLQSIAYGPHHRQGHTHYIATIFARDNEVYANVYDQGLRPIEDPRVVLLDGPDWLEWIEKYPNAALIKDSTWDLADQLKQKFRSIFPADYTARAVLALGIQQFMDGRWADLEKAVPFYLKEPNITTPKAKIPNRLNN